MQLLIIAFLMSIRQIELFFYLSVDRGMYKAGLTHLHPIGGVDAQGRMKNRCRLSRAEDRLDDDVENCSL